MPPFRRLGLSVAILFGIFLILPINFKVPMKDYYLAVDIKHPTPISPFYYLKLGREFLQSKFIFGSEDLSYWYFQLAEKRITEAEFLKKHSLDNLVKKQLQNAGEDQLLAERYLQDLIDKTDTNYLIEIRNSNDRRMKALES